MKHLQRFNEKAKVEKVSKKDEIEDFIEGNKKMQEIYNTFPWRI
jgi:hypothetical protein